jgi:hypothetical protein
MILIEYLGARGTLINEKKLKSKISCQNPFQYMNISLKKKGLEGRREQPQRPKARRLGLIGFLPS